MLSIGVCNYTFSQISHGKTSTHIYKDLLKLGTVGSVLYVAAHPDDENTRLISLLANEYHLETTYLSLTRGDGGQNLIGEEIGYLLGVLRTQELLQARKIDGGKQLFTRANDFGFSKTADETLEIWNTDAIKHDFIWAVRKTRPDIIINRFDHDSNGKTHGHHTASAMLSVENFEKAGDPEYFPDQLEFVSVWTPQSLFFNTSWWFFGSQEAFEKADKKDLYKVDIGTYYPLLGLSNNEIAAYSRSMHKCQGFGSATSRGENIEYLKYLKGKRPAGENLLDGYDFTWNRLEGGAEVAAAIEHLKATFNFSIPSENVTSLLKIRELITYIKDDFWKVKKIKEVDELIYNCAGLFLEANTNVSESYPGGEFNLNIEAINRSGLSIELKEVVMAESGRKLLSESAFLIPNVPTVETTLIQVENDKKVTTPYWLINDGTLGMYSVDDIRQIGLAESPAAYTVEYHIDINGQSVQYTKDVIFKYVDPAVGEVYQPFIISPPVTVNIIEPVHLFEYKKSSKIQVRVTAGKQDVRGSVSLNLDSSWDVKPEKYDFVLETEGQSRFFEFEVTPIKDNTISYCSASVIHEGLVYDLKMEKIEYDHISSQTVFRKNLSKFECIPLKKGSTTKIGYIAGSGDAVPGALKQIGYEVDFLDVKQSNVSAKFEEYAVIVLGIRVLNTVEEMKYLYKDLMNYVERGGVIIQQYNVNRPLFVENPGPFPLRVNRDRISEEDAELTILKPDHSIFNYPNKIEAGDFDGWVQERGLYFASEWSDKYVPLLSGHDRGESNKDGGMLVAEYGEGHFIYTGYSWFRQLPAGVPGAFKLFVNMISLADKNQ